MNEQTAERWVVISAVTVAGVYAYRRMIEPSAPPTTAKKLLGIGGLVPLGAFATAWGFVYLVVAAMATAAPGLGGGFAILIMASDLLTNSSDLFKDIGQQQKQKGLTAQDVMAATNPNLGTAPAGYSSALAAQEGFSNDPPSVHTPGINPNAPIYVPPIPTPLSQSGTHGGSGAIP